MRNAGRLSRIAGPLAAGLLALCAGCAAVHKAYEPNPRAAPMRPVAREAQVAWAAPPRTDGSIWSDAAMPLFTDNKALRPGDIVLVKVVQNNTGAKNADTNTQRASTISAKIKYLFGLEKGINKLADYSNKAAGGAAAAWDPNNLVDAESANSYKGSGETKRTDTLVATVSAVVTEVLPNGNLSIYGHQTVTINNEASVLTVQGIVRPSDINRDNTVDSQRIANADIQFTGSGVVSDKQHPGWGMRIFDWAWPF